jgi:hypothetical protein
MRDNRREKHISGGRVDRKALPTFIFSMPVSPTSAICLILSPCFLLARTIPIEAKIAKMPKAPPTAIPIIVDKGKVADPTGTCVCMDLVRGL